MSNAKPVRRLPLRVALRRSILAGVAAFAILMAVLSVRMAAGNDPALRPKLAAGERRSSAASPARAPAVVTLPSEEGESDDGVTVVTVPVAPAPSAPVTQPAPTPAPVQTTTS